MKFLKEIFESFDSPEQQTKIGSVMIELLSIRDQAHLYHLQTKSYAEHKALNAFYDSLLGLFDSLMEGIMGEYDTVYLGVGGATIQLQDYSQNNSGILLDRTKGVIETLKNTVGGKPGLDNIIDDIDTLVNETRYLLTLESSKFDIKHVNVIDLYSMSSRDAKNTEYNYKGDKRIVMYEFTTDDTTVSIVYGLQHPNNSEEDPKYLISVQDENGEIYSYKGRDIWEEFDTWEDGYKYLTTILKELGLSDKPEILKP